MADHSEGGCLCGAVRYRIEAAPRSTSVCHCADCRRAAGAPAVAWGTFPASAFRFTAGAPACFASSPGVERAHCAACGTSLTFRDDGATIDVTLASLDDPEALPPTSETWLRERLSWQAVDRSRTGHDQSSGGQARPSGTCG